MHKSRLCAVVIDCEDGNLEEAAAFWSAALGRPAQPPHPSAPTYRMLADEPGEPLVVLQRVDHPSRVHLDIEADDLEAEVKRLEALGARRVAHVHRWWVMEAPTGQRFCVVKPQRGPMTDRGHVWP